MDMNQVSNKLETNSSSRPTSSTKHEATIKRERETVEFSVKGPVSVHINDEELCCSLLDLIFALPSTIGELTFRNYYTMSVTVLVKVKSTPMDNGTNIGSSSTNLPKDDTSEWQLSIAKKIIMPYAHVETGSHDVVSISVAESLIEWRNLIGMRLILRQPSPVWRTFHIEEIYVYKDLPRRKEQQDSLLSVIKQQTINVLKWRPGSGSRPVQSQPGAYEFTNLPIP